ncbi:cell division cycle-associated protein 7 isoform X2 [Pseudonaja textilis]|uniref:cell division cycle-associated protein 7 isoform X2 n=1 Tax=Pseudonaja textilis TaxID=8673 RepID=UPI000EA8FF6E|nr:cell division cycle-associated protein 7 isoform X2 [Pseudonaja textilis]
MDPFGLQGNLSGKRKSRAFRNTRLIPMETSSSSDDSCDSFGSDNFANTKATFKPEVAEEMAKIFYEDSDEESFCGFSESEIQDVLKLGTDSEEEAEKCSRKWPKKSAAPLKVALKFPPRRSKRGKSNTVPASQPSCKLDSEAESDEESGPKFLERRALNIKENKAMLAKLMEELKSVSGIFTKRGPLATPTLKAQRSPRKSVPRSAPRRNPERRSRPHTRSRSLIEGPPNSMSMEEEEEDPYVLVRRKMSDDFSEDERDTPRRKRTSAMTLPHIIRPVEEITEEELDNICETVKEKVYNRATVSSHVLHSALWFALSKLCYRVLPVTSVVRKRQILRQIAGTQSVLEYVANSVGLVFVIVTEKKSGLPCWIQTGTAHLAVGSAIVASAGSGKEDVLLVSWFT